MTSLCDKCFAPGQCCKRIQFFAAGEEVTFWDDEPLEIQIRARMHSEDIDRRMPFVSLEKTTTFDAIGRKYSTHVFTCINLLKNGRCGDYENRPWLCRVFEPAGSSLCVHWFGAEGGEDTL